MKFKNYLNEVVKSEIPRGGAQHTASALKSFAKRMEKEEKRRNKIFSDPNTSFNKKIKEIEKNKPEWTKLEGENILKIKGSNLAALPTTGKKSSINFIVFNVNTREEITNLKKTEVYSWLVNAALRGE